MSHEILTVAEASAADRSAVARGVDSFALMQAAGDALARALMSRWPRQAVAVLCGPGLNGGDGYVAAEALRRAEWPVRVAAIATPATGDAARARAGFGGEVEQSPSPAWLEGSGLVIDALFGAGLSRPLQTSVANLLRAAEVSGASIVAADLPSGLQGDNGKPLGYAPRCALTVTFHRKKPAHLLEPGRGYCGEVRLADIGIPASATPSVVLWENHPDLWLARFPWPNAGSHKHSRGRLGVVTGGPSSTGAGRLAARAGLRSGAGLVRAYCPPDALAINAAHLEAIMLQAFETPGELEQQAGEMDAMIIGPAAGLDERTVANLGALARTGAALVVDADALSVFRDAPEALFALLDRDDVLTPHQGEFERVFAGLLVEAPERITAVRQAAQQAGAVVLLKGPDTVIAAPDGRAMVNANGSPWLATAGSGDVLAGIIGGLAAQGMDSFEAACAGVWMHAEAGRRFGPGLIAEDLPDLLPAVLEDLYNQQTGVH